jgi:histidine triad (HIT) family protein
MDEPTLFTKIIRGEIPSSKVAEGEHWYAFLDIYPRRSGHTLVVPKQQAQRIADLDLVNRQGLMDGVVEVQRRLSAEFGTSDFSVGIHDGPTAGQEVPHVHIHVCPRTFGDGGLSLLACWPNSPPPGGEPDFASLATLSERLQAH